MKLKFVNVYFAIASAISSWAICTEAAAVTVSGNINATTLASTILGTAISITNASFTTDIVGATPAGTFTSGGNIGFSSGVVLTTGTIDCVAGPNSIPDCSGPGTFSSLRFTFQSATGLLFFNYVFASEEYNEYVDSEFNDQFELRLNGINIALLPNGSGVVSINNVNCTKNSSYYRNNSDAAAGCANQGISTQFDGLTTVLTASAVVGTGANTFEFIVFDRGDTALDSAVFIQNGSFTGVIPEPSSIQLQAAGTLFLAGLFGVRRLTRRATAPQARASA
jgi:hypothetical protein